MPSQCRRIFAWHATRLMMLLLGLHACGGGGRTEPEVPSSITINPPSLSFTALGQTRQLSPTVLDQQGNALPDVAVSWSTSNAAVATVSPDGLVTAQGAGTAQLTASAGSVSAQVEVEVVAFNIEVRFIGSPSSSQQAAFADAQARWETLVTGDLEDVQLTAQPADCGPNSPAINEVVDDLIILVTLEDIDGAGGVLASAGPCFIRTSSDLPVLGAIRFDTSDLDDVEAAGLLSQVVLHEMGHVLGFGLGGLPEEPILWDDFLVDPSLTDDGQVIEGADPHFSGPQAIAAFDQIGGSAYTGAKVPVENEGGVGTQDSHWRESVFESELMTGFISSGQNPLSRVTVASLGDLGFVVNVNAADNFSLSLTMATASASRRLSLRDDVLRLPVKKVDAAGRVTSVLRP
jgi:hypothetical protein